MVRRKPRVVYENLRKGQVYVKEKYEDGSVRHRAFPPLPRVNATMPGTGPNSIVAKAAKRAAQRSKGRK